MVSELTDSRELRAYKERQDVNLRFYQDNVRSFQEKYEGKFVIIAHGKLRSVVDSLEEISSERKGMSDWERATAVMKRIDPRNQVYV